MNTSFEEIVSVPHIGSQVSPLFLPDILTKGSLEGLVPARKDAERVLFLAIDVQRDFIESPLTPFQLPLGNTVTNTFQETGGSLAVPGSIGDVERMSRFIYKNFEKITQIAVSLDTHRMHQIFHPFWWIDENGSNPKPLTVITLQDVIDGKWKPVMKLNESVEYLKGLEAGGKKALVIWPVHCIEGTPGHSLEQQFANMVMFHAAARKMEPVEARKGYNPVSEMYGIIKSEFDPANFINMFLLKKIALFDKIIIAGEAKSHCVVESIIQIFDHFDATKSNIQKFYILEDCMSTIPGFEKTTEDAFDEFKRRDGVHIVKSTEFQL